MLVNAIIGFLLGYAFVALLPYVWLGLKILWELMVAVFELCQTIFELVKDGVLLKKTNFKNPSKPPIRSPHTPKEKIELMVGLVAIAYTLALVAVAMFSDVLADVLIAAWLILTAITSYLGNRYLKRITSEPI